MQSRTRSLRPIILTLFALTMAWLSGGSGLISASAPTRQTATLLLQPQPTPTPMPMPPILLTDPVPDLHQPSVQWFASTGHTLRGAFLDYWTRYGGLAQFGYPLTEEFFEPIGTDTKRQYQVQYFERNRFEHHPENAGTPYEVLLGALGRDFRTPDPPASPLPAPARYFDETGHNLSGAFLNYWETHGELFVHGFPITEPFQETNPIDKKPYTVQYFERSRFEHHPENAGSEYEVLLGLLGRQLSEKKGYPYGWYPLWGRAPDYSWVSGDVWLYGPDPYCQATMCGCAITRVETRYNSLMQMLYAPDLRWPAVLEGYYWVPDARPHYVFFGRKAAPGEKHVVCVEYPNAAGYVSTRSQRNPASQAP